MWEAVGGEKRSSVLEMREEMRKRTQGSLCIERVMLSRGAERLACRGVDWDPGDLALPHQGRITHRRHLYICVYKNPSWNSRPLRLSTVLGRELGMPRPTDSSCSGVGKATCSWLTAPRCWKNLAVLGRQTQGTSILNTLGINQLKCPAPSS
jgi:hypothetical protein